MLLGEAPTQVGKVTFGVSQREVHALMLLDRSLQCSHVSKVVTSFSLRGWDVLRSRTRLYQLSIGAGKLDGIATI